MSKLETILESLRGNSLVKLGDVDTTPFVPPKAGWSETVEIYVGPVDSINDVDELQKFMMGLVPIKESRFGHAGEIRAHCYAGRLYFYDESDDPVMRCIVVNVYSDPFGAVLKTVF